MSEIFICHTGTDTWFSLADTGYIVDGTIAENNDVDGGMESGYLAETAKLHGYEITPELAQKIYELVRSHYES
jgi:hypothetical protein